MMTEQAFILISDELFVSIGFFSFGFEAFFLYPDVILIKSGTNDTKRSKAVIIRGLLNSLNV